MSKKYNRNVYPAVVSVSAAECNGGLGILYLSGGSAKAVRTARLPAESVCCQMEAVYRSMWYNRSVGHTHTYNF